MTKPGTLRQRAFRARQYAAGKHYIRGQLTDRPYRNRRPGEVPPHGTRARYVWQAGGPCRCDECRTASTDAHREWRHRRTA